MGREFFDIQFRLLSTCLLRLMIFPLLLLWMLSVPWKLAAQDSQPAIGGVVNAATYDPSQPLAPGTIIAIFGSNLSDGSTQPASQTPLPTVLAGAQVLVNGTAIPLFFVSPGQINAQFPYAIPISATTATIHVEVETAAGSATSGTLTVSVAQTSPGVFTLDQSGRGPGIYQRPIDYRLICPGGRSECSRNPARPGETLTIYLTGLGRVVAGSSTTPTRPKVQFGGVEAVVSFSGLTPGFVGLYQINAVVPSGVPPDDAVPLTISLDGGTTSAATIAVGPGARPLTGGGPPGGEVVSLAVAQSSPSILYAASTSGGAFKSTDAGRSWQGINAGFPIPYMKSIAVNPRNPSVAYAETSSRFSPRGLYRTTDGGQNWTNIVGDVSSVGIVAFDIDPVTPNILYMFTGSSGLLKSVDSGNTWSVVAHMPGNRTGRALAIDPSSPNVLYAGAGEVVVHSVDGGTTWTLANSGLGDRNTVQAVAVDPRSSGTVYAGIAGAGIFKTTDSGQTWTAINNGLGTAPGNLNVRAISVSRAADPSVIYIVTNGGVFKSTNRGESWSSLGITVSVVITDPANPSVVYAALRGVSKSTDGGSTWNLSNSGLAAADISSAALVLHPQDPSTIYAGSISGIFRSPNRGESWERLHTDHILSLAISPANGSFLYAGTAGGNVLRSTDAGATWQTTSSSPCLRAFGGPGVHALGIDPINPSTILVACGIQIYRSTDAGDTWTRSLSFVGGITIGSDLLWEIVTHPTSPSAMYAVFQAADIPSGNVFFYRSTDGGVSWSQTHGQARSLAPGVSIAVHPADPQLVYYGAAFNFLQRSTDGGRTWTELSFSAVYSIALHPEQNNTIFGGRGGVLYRSDDAGQRWQLVYVSEGFKTNIQALAIDPTDPSVMFAGTPAGVYRSFDGGESWDPTSASQ